MHRVQLVDLLRLIKWVCHASPNLVDIIFYLESKVGMWKDTFMLGTQEV